MTDSKKLLVIEDDPSLRGAIRDKFTRENFSILESSNGQDGLAKALAEHPDIIILDLVMPILDGLSFAEKLRRDVSWGAKVPIIILTNLSESDQVGRALSLGIHDFLVKSDTSMEKLVIKVRQKLNLV